MRYVRRAPPWTRPRAIGDGPIEPCTRREDGERAGLARRHNRIRFRKPRISIEERHAVRQTDTYQPTGFVTQSDAILLSQCDMDHYRASGPGGQKRNKTSSAVRLRHRPTGLSVTAVDNRSQAVNKQRALRRMREAIALSVRTDVDPESYTPSDILLSCIGADGRIAVNRRNERYYPIVCEMLDVLWSCRTRVSLAGSALTVSTAQLVSFLKKDPKLFGRVNQMRAECGARPLRND